MIATPPRPAPEKRAAAKKAATPVFRVSEWPIAHFARIERQHVRNATRVLAPHGLHHREWRMLAIIDEIGTTSVTVLAEQAVIERSTIGKMLMRLEQKGLVERVDAAEDGRASPVRLTLAGRALLAKSVKLIQQLFDQYQACMSSAEYSEMMRLVVVFKRGVDSVAISKGEKDD